MKVFGERSIGSNRWRRFSVVHPVPQNCEANKLHRKFEGGIVTIIMPKKVVSKPKDQELVKLPPPTQKPTPSGEAKMAQMGKEVISQEPRSSEVDDKVEASVPPKVTTGASVAPKDKKVQADEVVGSVLETGENKGVAMKERKEDIAKPKSSKEVGKVPPEVKAQTGEEGRKQMLARAVSENGISRGAEKKESKEDIEKSSEVRKASETEVTPPKLTTRVEEEKEAKAQIGQEGKNEKLAVSVLENSKNIGAEKKENKEDLEKTSEVRKASEVIPPKPATRVGEKEVSARKGQEGLNEKHVGSVSENGKIKGAEKKASKEASEARKDSEVIPLKSTTRVEEKKEEKNEKLAGTVLENGENRGAEKETTEAKRSLQGKAQKGKAPIAEADADEKGHDGKNEKLAGPISENGKNRGAENEETKSEVTGKTTSNVGNLSSPSPIDLVAEKEIKGERKESTKREENDGKFGNFKEGGKGLKDVINFSKGNKVIASASEVVTRMAKRFNEEDKQMMIYVGAAVLVTTVISVCASYTFRSLGRS